jgi:hypothetical protein
MEKPMEGPVEEKKKEVIPLWTEDQWEKWVYSFAAEVEGGESTALFFQSISPEEKS